jgi:hypothetical protein
MSSRIRLHPLLFAREADSWVVGRRDTGDFVELPDEAVTFMKALDDGDSVETATAIVRQRHGGEIDALDFVTALQDLGFIASVDGRGCGTAVVPPSLPRLERRHVRWIFTRPVYACVGLFIVGGFIAALIRGELVPRYQSYFITEWQFVNVTWNTATFLLAIAIHEFWHLSAARAEDVHARVSLGTRLHFLVVQTTVAGLWGAPRRVRMRVYLAGMTSDLLIAAACSLAISMFEPAGFVRSSLDSLILSLLLAVAGQFALYIRTDMYFVLQELLRCKNLHVDAWDYVRYLFRRTFLAGVRLDLPSDPTLDLPAKERRPVKIYSIFMAAGSVSALGIFAAYGAPILVTLLVHSAMQVVSGLLSGDLLKIADGLLVLAIEGTLQLILVRLLIKKHGRRLAMAWSWCRRQLGSARSRRAAPGA